MADDARVRRVAENIRGTVTRALERSVKDPRLGFVTITEVRVTRDLQHATVFYTVLGDENSARDTAKALRSATGLIRSEVGRSLGTRLTPTLTFEADAIPEAAASIEDKLREARERDAEIAREREGKKFAGGADPYRKDDEDE
ncbi:30S ribosome-binding factor RbfA [Actinomycetaceae bacterium WB03_NA08]|uniref:Ribosome-binding factor A n=1 Tax=Scrofimicrobium canadense TaxID=2652290 RepID=A0A6N7W8S3_9ACTO|nr:30S ribosome-binding factor RbfA [Scrofimicrobium canadense]MSS84893.1 30S ribosome-binding factor RbfA [Scrofimicrobium canadense]